MTGKRAGKRSALDRDQSEDGLKPLWQKKKEHVEGVLDHANYDLWITAEILGITVLELGRLMRELEIPERNRSSESGQALRQSLGQEAPDET